MKKSKTTAAIFALLGGMIGMHKFYLNDPGSGIFYTFLTIAFGRFFPIALILGVIDAIRLFSMSDEQFDTKYNKKAVRRSVQRRRKYNSSSERERDMQRDRYKYKETKTRKRSNPFRKSADLKFKEYDLEGALDDYQKAAEISEPDKNVHFNLACIYSLMEKKENSFHHLEEAVKLGYKNVEKISTVDELAFLRIQPEFVSFKENGFIMKRSRAVNPPKDDLLQDDLLLSQLNKLKELRTRGLLSEKEFSLEKQKLLRK